MQGVPAPHKARVSNARKARAHRAPSYRPHLGTAVEHRRALHQAALELLTARLELYVGVKLTVKEAVLLSRVVHMVAEAGHSRVVDRDNIVGGLVTLKGDRSQKGVVRSLKKKQLLSVDTSGLFVSVTGQGFDVLSHLMQSLHMDPKVQLNPKSLENAMTAKTAAVKLASAKVEKPAEKPVEKKSVVKAAPPAKKETVKKEAAPKGDRTFAPTMTVGEFMEAHAGHKVTLLTDVNPKHGKSAKRFDLYKNGMTVEAAVEKGVLPADLRWDASPHHAWRNAKGEVVRGAYIKLTK